MRVLTIGTFDMLHPGHLELLRACRAMGHVVVAVNTDLFVARYKRRPPVIPLDGRMDMLRECRSVDEVTVNDGDEDAGVVIRRVGPDILAIGSDWLGRDYLGQLHVTQSDLDRLGVEVVYVPRTTIYSTTALRG